MITANRVAVKLGQDAWPCEPVQPERYNEPMQPAEQRHRNQAQATTYRVGCVSYLNSKPLIEGVDDHPQTHVRFDVPARLLGDLETGEVDIALCPVIDYFRSHQPLAIVPVGGICCEGPTFTVRLYSQTPIDQVQTIFGDSDSHTSVALVQVVLEQRFGIRPRMVEYHAREQVAEGKIHEKPQTMLLIGDKVVTDSPLAVEYPYQLDLGQAWNELTGLPFMFAVWMARPGVDLGTLPERLTRQREINAEQLDAVVDRYAPAHHWPRELAHRYLGSILQYKIDDRHLEAMRRFGRYAVDRGLIDRFRELVLYQRP